MPKSATQRSRTTSRSVHRWDRVASAVISFGGFGVLAAILAICFYLAWVVVPLFRGGSIEQLGQGATDAQIVDAILGPNANTAATLSAGSGLRFVRLDTGEPIVSLPIDGDQPVTSYRIADGGERVAFGFGDGTVRLGSITIEPRVLAPDQIPQAALDLPIGGATVTDGAYIDRPRQDQFRSTSASLTLGEPLAFKEGDGAVTHVDYAGSTTGRSFLVAERADGTLLMSRIRTVRPLGGGKPRMSLSTTVIGTDHDGAPGAPLDLFVSSDGRHVFVVWTSGECDRFAIDTRGKALHAERVRLAPDGITTVGMLLGAQTLIVGGERGTLRTWFAARDLDADTPDGFRLVPARTIDVSGAPIESVRSSPGDRSIAVVDADARVSLVHATSGKRVATSATGVPSASLACVAPRGDGVLVMNERGAFELFALDPGFADISARTLFGRIRYEGQAESSYVYQSSGDDASEPKMSLMPLVFGTIKATVFAMLFAVPVAVLAALYTSEFLHRDVRRVVKPAVEMMASLPSVVLGFVAAIVVAPYVRTWLPSILLALFIVPLGVILAAHVWQLLPRRVMRRLTTSQHLSLVAVVLAACLGVSAMFGPLLERALFTPSRADALALAGSVEPIPEAELPAWAQGRDAFTNEEQHELRAQGIYVASGVPVRAIEPRSDAERAMVAEALEKNGLADPSIRRWLDGSIGDGASGWVLVLIFPSLMCVWAAYQVFGAAGFRAMMARQSRSVAAFGELVKLIALVTTGFVVAFVCAQLLGAGGLDPRDSVFGPFSQRNTLVVAFIMGFAVIPIIFTISEDALQAVPPSLRSASLGAGATPWQTAVRVVLPVAGSGIFSACMIGLGRAVGETMIVLMATGNTPEMSWNIFSGFRTLAANIAVELPEAELNSAHYRVLFLCGFVLFVMTFVINATAEVVRRHFRKRSAAL